MSGLRRRRDVSERDDTSEPLLTSEDVYEEQHTYKNHQIVVHQPFSVETFLAFVYQRWQAFLLAFQERLWYYFRPAAPAAGVSVSLVQAERLNELKEKLSIPYDGNNVEHQDSLRKLWELSFPDVPLTSLKTPYWKNMGWQGDDPGTDFRGAGIFGLENLIYFAENEPAEYSKLLAKTEGVRSEWEYPFAVAGLNITFMLEELLGLRNLKQGLPATPAGLTFLNYLGETNTAFEELYCMVFRLLDIVWLRMRASYMEFGAVMQAVKKQLDLALKAKPATLIDLRFKLLGS